MSALRRDVFQGIADPTRRGILSLLAQQPMNLNAIADQFEMSRPAISQHIKLLHECGLVVVKQRGRERICEPDLQKLTEVADWIAPFKKMWEERFDQLDNYLQSLQNKKQ